MALAIPRPGKKPFYKILYVQVLTRIIHEGGRRIRRAVGVAQVLERT